MRILLVHPHDIHSPREPWTRRIKSLAKEFVAAGHEVKLVYFPLSFKRSAPGSSLNYQEVPLNRSSSPLVFIRNIRRLMPLAEWADVVHFQKCHHYAAVPAIIASYFKRKPLHYDWDDWEEMIWYESCGNGLHSRFIGSSFKILERFLPVLADSVSVASQGLRDLAKQFGVKDENIYEAPVGADLAEFRTDIDRTLIKKEYRINSPLVLYIGQLHGAQYIDLFIKAANIILHRIPDVVFMIVGEGFMEKYLRGLACELGIEQRVVFTGSVAHHKIPYFIAAADVCVAPFKDTPVTRCKSPLKIVEYLACGKAIVASNVGETRRMLGGAGILVEPNNFYSLADGIIKVLRDERLRTNLSRFSRQRVEKTYNWNKTASSLLKAYEDLCSRAR